MKKQIFTLAIAGLLSSGLYASADDEVALDPSKIEKSPTEIGACFTLTWGIVIHSDGTAVILPDNIVINENILNYLDLCERQNRRHNELMEDLRELDRKYPREDKSIWDPYLR